ncbi:hypothetical protein GQ44DRAFT_772417 [Phaeosphaeriaceae sp. PMI808]|nr:hypothetical protein GQ44DRAFT_772417 [Phaeosphaeriaceae sp. PMI808]
MSGSIVDYSKYEDLRDRNLYSDPKLFPSYQNRYTNLAKSGGHSSIWLCPHCPRVSNAEVDWIHLSRGYTVFPTNPYTNRIADGYGTDRDNKLFFQNPPFARRCLNRWGPPGVEECGFNRAIAEGCDANIPDDGTYFGLAGCTECSLPWPFDVSTLDEGEKERLAKRMDYIKSCTGSEFIYKTHAAVPEFSLRNKTAWDGKKSYFRFLGSTQGPGCASGKWGAGLSENSENTPCRGVYGARPGFWKKGDDGEWSWEAWVPVQWQTTVEQPDEEDLPYWSEEESD